MSHRTSSAGRSEFLWIDNEFTPAEFATLSGLSTEMQRHWRRRAHLPRAKEGRTATFTAHDIATVRLMLMLEHPLKSRPLAKDLARHVVWLALCDHPETWDVEGPLGEATAYRNELERLGNSHIDHMARINGREVCRFLVFTDARDPIAVNDPQDALSAADDDPMFVTIDLVKVARQLVRGLNGKRLMTVLIPKEPRRKPHDKKT